MTTLVVDGFSVAVATGGPAAGFAAPDSRSTFSPDDDADYTPVTVPDSSVDTSGMPSHLAYALSNFVSGDGGSAPLSSSYAGGTSGNSIVSSGGFPVRPPITAHSVGLSKISAPVATDTKASAGAAQSLQTNPLALNAYRNVLSANAVLTESLQRLSTGKRINSAADDAAGLAISEGIKSQVLGNKQAVRNAQDGISLVQTAEGVLGTVHNMLQRMRVLAVQGANATNTGEMRAALAGEMDALRQEIGRIGEVTEAMGRRILGGRYKEPADALRFEIGAGATEFDTIAITFVDVVDIAKAQLSQIPQNAGQDAFRAAIGNIDTQIDTISTARATLGSVQNRFESTIHYLNVSVENLASAHGRIQDADYALETVNYMRGRILTQSSNAMLSQAIKAPRGVLSLLDAA